MKTKETLKEHNKHCGCCEKEFNLNERVVKCYTENSIEGCEEGYHHWTKWDIKEFIKRLKELQDKIIGRIEQVMKKPMPNVKKYAKEEIDKLAGDKLI